MKYRVFLPLAFLLVLLQGFCQSETEKSSFTVFGYLPEYRLGGFDYAGAFANGLTHLIFFSLEVDARTFLPKALDRLPSKEDLRRAREAADSVGGKLMLSFGGNARSAGFGEMTATPKTRRKFLDALNTLLEENDLDGVDYNWEYPRSAEEWDAWGLLMHESKQLLLRHRRTKTNDSTNTTGASTASSATAQSKSQSSRSSEPVVSFTMYLDPNHFKVIERFDLLASADYVHCMAYDARGKHSTIEFAKQGIQLAQSVFGARRRQWTLGLPFYGRDINTGEPKAYYELAGSVVQSGRVRTGDQIGSVYFNSHRTLRRKIELAREGGVGGVMIWELGQDTQPFNRSESLMSAIRAATVPASLSEKATQDGGEDGGNISGGGIMREEL